MHHNPRSSRRSPAGCRVGTHQSDLTIVCARIPHVLASPETRLLHRLRRHAHRHRLDRLGPPLVRAAHWLSHVEHDLESPVWRPWLLELSRHHTYIRYDQRGCGLSDRDVADLSLDAWVGDLEAVVDSLGLQRFPLFGMSQGGAVAIDYAVRHPERVSHLVLMGAYARGALRRARTAEERLESETLINLARIGWGRDNPAFRQVFTNLFIPGGTPQQHQWWSELSA